MVKERTEKFNTNLNERLDETNFSNGEQADFYLEDEDGDAIAHGEASHETDAEAVSEHAADKQVAAIT